MPPITDPPGLPDGYVGPIEVTSKEDLEEVFQFRAKVWSGEDWLVTNRDEVRLRDQYEASSRHWVVRHQGVLVAAIRLSLHDNLEDLPDFELFPKGLAVDVPPPFAYSGRLVVDAAHRSRGIAKALDQLAIHMARQSGVNALFGMVPPYRVRGLSEIGFKVLCRTQHPFTDDIPSTILLVDLRPGQKP